MLYLKEKRRINEKESLQTGMITQSDYDRMMKEVDEYATIIKYKGVF